MAVAKFNVDGRSKNNIKVQKQPYDRKKSGKNSI
jgi:hypothetical protein